MTETQERREETRDEQEEARGTISAGGNADPSRGICAKKTVPPGLEIHFIFSVR